MPSTIEQWSAGFEPFWQRYPRSLRPLPSTLRTNPDQLLRWSGAIFRELRNDQSIELSEEEKAFFGIYFEYGRIVLAVPIDFPDDSDLDLSAETFRKTSETLSQFSEEPAAMIRRRSRDIRAGCRQVVLSEEASTSRPNRAPPNACNSSSSTAENIVAVIGRLEVGNASTSFQGVIGQTEEATTGQEGNEDGEVEDEEVENFRGNSLPLQTRTSTPGIPDNFNPAENSGPFFSPIDWTSGASSDSTSVTKLIRTLGDRCEKCRDLDRLECEAAGDAACSYCFEHHFRCSLLHASKLESKSFSEALQLLVDLHHEASDRVGDYPELDDALAIWQACSKTKAMRDSL